MLPMTLRVDEVFSEEKISMWIEDRELTSLTISMDLLMTLLLV